MHAASLSGCAPACQTACHLALTDLTLDSSRSYDARMNELLDLRNTGLFRMGTDNGPGGVATIAIAGVPRSGTSMIAAILHEAGVYLGGNFEPGVFEDRDIADAIEADDPARLREIAARNNAAHRIWGFKRPKSYARLNDVLAELRAPRVIITMRDPVAIAMRNSISTYKDTLDSIRFAAKSTLEVARMLEALNYPALVLSYEKAIANPEGTCAALLTFIGMPADAALVARMAARIQNAPAAYLKATLLRYDGEISISPDGAIAGWIMSNNSEFPPVDLVRGTDTVCGLELGPKITRPPSPGLEGGFYRSRSLSGRIAPVQVGSDLHAQVRGTVFRLRRT